MKKSRTYGYLNKLKLSSFLLLTFGIIYLFGCNETTISKDEDLNTDLTDVSFEEVLEDENMMDSADEPANEESTEDEELFLYKYTYKNGDSNSERDNLSKTFLYDSEGNYLKSTYSNDQLSHLCYYTNSYIIDCSDFLYEKPDPDCNLDMLYSYGAITLYANTYFLNNSPSCYNSDEKVILVEMNEKGQLTDFTSDNSDEINWDDDGNCFFKYSRNDGYRERKYINNRIVYYDNHEDGQFYDQNKKVWKNYSEKSEYEYDEDGKLIWMGYESPNGFKGKIKRSSYFVYNQEGDIVAIINDADDNGVIEYTHFSGGLVPLTDNVRIIWHNKEYDEKGNLIKHEMFEESFGFLLDETGTFSKSFYSEDENEMMKKLENKSIDELQDICIELSENILAGNIKVKTSNTDRYVETWEYKTLSEILSKEK